MNITEFKKKIFKKGHFNQYVITPYFGNEKNSINNRVIIFSDKVSESTDVTSRGKKFALILPARDNIQELLKSNIEKIASYTEVDATFFTLWNLEQTKAIAQIQK